MSDYYIRLIPEDIDAKISDNALCKIRALIYDEQLPKIHISNQVQFADAGQNFVYVKCPYCGHDLLKWWGDSMAANYSENDGFVNLTILTPCCNIQASLHDLNYHFSQGFYRIMVEFVHESSNDNDLSEICDKIAEITGEKWRVIKVHY